MKKTIPTAIIAIGTFMLGACTPSPENAAADNGSDMMAPNMAMKADNMEEMAEARSDAMAANMMASSENANNMGTGGTSAVSEDSARPKPAQNR